MVASDVSSILNVNYASLQNFARNRIVFSRCLAPHPRLSFELISLFLSLSILKLPLPRIDHISLFRLNLSSRSSSPLLSHTRARPESESD